MTISTTQTSIALIAKYESATLEEMLVALCQVGEPRLSRLANGWYCAVDMHVSAAGTSFNVASEFSRQTPSDAVKQVSERVIATLKKYAE